MFYYWYGAVSLALAGLFLYTFGPRIPADWFFYGWKKALAMTALIIGFCWLLPPIVVGIILYLGVFWMYQSFTQNR